MKTSTKLWLGVGVFTVVGIATTAVISDKVIENIKTIKTRHKIKQFVADKFDGNEQLLDIIENLSVNEVLSIGSVLAKVQAQGKKISVSGKSFKEASEDIKNLLNSFVKEHL